MYAIIRAGGKQAKVQEGDVIDVERIKDGTESVTFQPLLLVNEDGSVVSDPSALAKASVTAEVVGEHRGPKVEVFKYKAKTGYRRRQGHRQTYTTIKVTSIAAGAKKASTAKKKAAEKPAADESAEDQAATAATTETGTEKAPARKAPAEKAETAAEKTPAKKTPAKKAPAKKTPAKKTDTAAKTTTKRSKAADETEPATEATEEA